MGSFDRKTAGTMKRILNGVGIVLGTLLLMVIGLFLSRVIWLQTHHKYDSMPHGYRWGVIWITVSNLEPEIDESTFFQVRIDASSKPEWIWRQPESFNYSRIQLSGGAARYPLTVQLPECSYTTTARTGTIAPNMLAEWMTDHPPKSERDQSYQNASWLMAFMQACHEGQLPRPRHHPYGSDELRSVGVQVPAGIQVTVLHGLSGMGFWWPDYVWIVVWGLLVSLIARKRLRSKQPNGA